FFSALRAWSTLLSRTRTCTQRSFASDMPNVPEPADRHRSATARALHDVGVYQNQREESIAVLTSCRPRAPPGLLRSEPAARLRAAWPLRRRQAQARSRRAAPR